MLIEFCIYVIRNKLININFKFAIDTSGKHIYVCIEEANKQTN